MIKEEGNYYHIYNRGHNKERIFFEEENYLYFLRQFKKFLIPHVDVFAYCLLPNHFHFFIKINKVEEFEKGIKNFFISYSRSINQKYNRVGSLFQGRYKTVEIHDDAHFTRMVTYIHQNPLKAGLVKKIEDYKFSSYPAYVSGRLSLVNCTEVLNWYGGIDEFKNCH
jgi:putative transposase